MFHHRCPRFYLVLALLIALAAPAYADAPATCDGPDECCPKKLQTDLPAKVAVAVGVIFRGIYNVDDKLGTWEADYYLYESWKPTEGFLPQTQVVNEVNRQSSQFDETVLHQGRCVRSRQIHSTLHARYNLQHFPFDEQKLVLQLADAEFDSSDVGYEATPVHLGLDSDSRDQLVAWQVLGPPAFTLGHHAFSPQPGAPTYDEATISITVRRQVEFYLTRFFFPLLLIVAVALTVFWIHPEDLSSQVSIGVTCLLAVIAFQFAQANSLPAVGYLTFADRVYAICYFAIALAMIESITGNTLARRGKHERAERVDRICRWAFPLGIAGLVALSYMSTMRSH